MLNQDFTDILSAFIEEKVEFLVVGSYAMAFHGYIRGTGDIDLWVSISRENASKVLRALKIFGAPPFDWTVEDLLVEGMVFQIGVVPSRIDIVTSVDGLSFEDAWNTRSSVEIDGMQIPIVGKLQLIVNKKASGRPKDLNDVLWLESEQP